MSNAPVPFASGLLTRSFRGQFAGLLRFVAFGGGGGCGGHPALKVNNTRLFVSINVRICGGQRQQQAMCCSHLAGLRFPTRARLLAIGRVVVPLGSFSEDTAHLCCWGAPLSSSATLKQHFGTTPAAKTRQHAQFAQSPCSHVCTVGCFYDICLD